MAMRNMQRTVGILSLCILLSSLVVGEVWGQGPGAQKKPLEIERLYTYPKLEGTAPAQAAWSKDSAKIAFLWNDKGYPFRDLWVYDRAAKKLTRLTNLEQPRDQWTESPAEKDPKLKKYLPPETGLAGFAWSPDASRLAVSFRGELYVVAADGSAPPQRLTRTKEAEAAPKFSPDSRRLLFTRAENLWVLDLATGQVTQLTTDGSDDLLNTGSPDWSPDGAWVSFLQTNRKEERVRLIPNYSGVEVGTRRQKRTFAKDETNPVRLGIVPAAGGPVRWLTEAVREYIRDIQWAPDSTRLALLRKSPDHKQQRIDLIPLAEPSTPKTLYAESDPAWICTLCNFLAWSPDGKRLLFSSERDGWNQLYLLDVDAPDAAPQQLTRGAWEVDTGYRAPAEIRPRFSADGQRIYFTSTAVDSSERHLYALSLAEGSAPRRLTPLAGYNGAVVSPDDNWIAIHYSSWAKPWDLYLAANQPGAPDSGAKLERITSSPLPEFDTYQWPQPQVIDLPSRDGKKLRALLFQPTTIPVDITRTTVRGKRSLPGRPAAPKVPGIVFVHGAGYAQSVLNRWGGYSAERFQFNQFLAQRGYLVLDLDYRGSSGYGHDWRTDVYLHLGGKDLQDELAGVDYLKTIPYVDTDRLGIWGVSYGGFMTLMALFTAPDVFRAGSAWAAVVDWENYQRHYTQERLRTPESEPEAYRRSSPISHVAGLKGHLQIIHGMADDNVHFQDAVQLIDALVAAGKDFETVIYPQENHSWDRVPVWIHSFRATFAFFERHLQPAPR